MNGQTSHAGLRSSGCEALNAFLARHLPRPGDPQGRPHSRPQVLNNGITARRCRGSTCRGGIYAHIAGIDLVRVGAERLLRAGRQPAHAVRRLLHAGKPRDDDAAVPRAVRAPQRWRRSSTTPSMLLRQHCAPWRRPACNDPTVVVLTPGRLQQRLFRARLPGPADGRRAGRGPGPVRRATTRSSCAPPRARSGST